MLRSASDNIAAAFSLAARRQTATWMSNVLLSCYGMHAEAAASLAVLGASSSTSSSLWGDEIDLHPVPDKVADTDEVAIYHARDDDEDEEDSESESDEEDEEEEEEEGVLRTAAPEDASLVIERVLEVGSSVLFRSDVHCTFCF